MRFTNDEKKYIFNCISRHSNEIMDIFDKNREYLSVAPPEFRRLTHDLFRMIEDMDCGADLLIRLHDDIEYEDDYQSRKDSLLENQKTIQVLKYSFQKVKAAFLKSVLRKRITLSRSVNQ
jgi:hypothetical protein